MNKTLLRLCIFFALAASAPAEIIGVEQFDYPDGAIAGKTGGTFWDYKNISPVGHTGTPSNWDNITNAPAASGSKLVTNSSSAKREYNGANEGDGAVNDPASAPSSAEHTVYYRVTVTTGATLPDFFGLSSYDFGTERIFFGKTFGSSTFSLTGGTGAVTTNNVAVTANTTYTLVTKIDFVNDIIALYVNPDLNALESSQTPAASAPYTGTNFSTAVRLASGNTGSGISWDNLVVATTWADLGTVVNTTADTDGGASVLNAGGAVSLREAMKYSPNGTLITFDPSLSGQTITLTGGALQPANGIATVDASSLPLGITIDGNRASRLFTVTASQTLTLHTLTLTGGNGVDPSLDTGFGGAIDNAGILTATDCTVAHNIGGGGAILSHGTATLMRCTLTANSSGSGGGALLLSNGTATLTRCTVSGNTNAGANGGGGIDVGSAAHLVLNDTIVAGNVDTAFVAADISTANGGTVTAVGANLIGQNTTVATTFPAGPLAGTAAAPLDPKLSPLGYFGGPTQTMHPLIGSPAIDTGGTTNPGTADQRGFPGFIDGDASGTVQLDIGAVEAGLLFVVHTVGDGAGSTLRFDINNSAGLLGVRLGFDPTKFPAGNVTLSQGELAITGDANGLFIDASNLSGPVTISGNNASRVFNIASGATVAMNNLVITGGHSSNGSFGGGGGDGGGIYSAGRLSVHFSSVTSNQTGKGGDSDSNGGNGGYGGGIYSSGPLDIAFSTVASNQTGNGGNGPTDGSGDGGFGAGIYCQDRLDIAFSTIAGNQNGNGGTGAHPGGGGRAGGIESVGVLKCRRSTIANNRTGLHGNGSDAGSGGGIVLNQPAMLEHTTVAANQTGNGNSGFAGGIDCGFQPLTLRDSIVASNSAGSGSPDINSLGTVIYQDANFVGNTSGIGSTTGTPPLTGAALLAPLGDYGGPTQTIALSLRSPAINAGTVSDSILDQRQFPFVGAPDLGAFEYQGNADLSRYWTTDWDGDGLGFGVEYALGTDPLTSDRNNTRNLTAPAFNAMGQATLSFGRNSSAQFGTVWQLYRSTDLIAWTQIYNLDANGNQMFDGANFSVSLGTNSVTLTDKTPPFPKAFYEFRATFNP